MPFHICISPILIIPQVLSERAIGWNDISEYLQKNESRNISDFLQIDFSHLQHFGYISGTKSSTLFFLFTRKYIWIFTKIRPSEKERILIFDYIATFCGTPTTPSKKASKSSASISSFSRRAVAIFS